MDKIVIKGAKTHNLKNISLEIPRDKFVVITGLSGSGKSSLAFDTIYAEGQRRYVESLSSYARQFLGQMDKPDVELITGLSPAVAIEQKGPGYNPRSIVGTMTEIYDYMRVLYARIGVMHCPECSVAIAKQTKDEILEKIEQVFKDKKIAILAPIVSGRKGEYKDLFARLLKAGYARVKVDGGIFNLEEEIKLDKNKKHSIDIVVDRLEIIPENKSRIFDSVEIALKESQGSVIIQEMENDKNLRKFSESMTCPECGISYGEIEPRDFSFNNPFGACPVCTGLGFKIDFDSDLVIPDKSISIRNGAVKVMGYCTDGWSIQMMDSFARENGFSIDVPVSKMKKEDLKKILYGADDSEYNFKYDNEETGTKIDMRRKYEGVMHTLERRYRESSSEDVKREYEKYMRTYDCPGCGGKRLSKKALSVKIDGKSIFELCNLSIRGLFEYVSGLKLDDTSTKIARGLLKEIRERLQFLVNVGLDYLNLFRRADTLSGGEAQRINLATQIGAGLMGVLYVLDEPSIGLHQKDNKRLIDTLLALRDIGNTLIVVEHDEETIRKADWVVDLGPGAGENGGKVIFNGSLDSLLKSKDSLTAKYLNNELRIEVPSTRREPRDFLVLKKCRENNLKNIDVKIPLGVLCCVTGVSGSGKSTLVHDILFQALSKHFYGSREMPGKHDGITGLEKIDKIINIDQSPIGRTPRSNPVTYTGVFTQIRDLFSALPESKAKGFKPGRFSFNVKGGRCESCQGSGVKEIKMHFLPDVYVICDVCHGKRFDSQTLEVKFKGKSIYDVLDMTVSYALTLFEKIPAIRKVLTTLDEVGLGYIKLGQAATTLSGGEAQRVKLATYLSKRSTGKTLYMLDEPTTGLHFADTEKLLKVLHRFVDTGNTVLVIEHNLDVIKTADYIIDLGPEGGDKGGMIVAQGTPEALLENKKSYTGYYLRKSLKR